METQTIVKSKAIRAPKEKVFNLLTDDKATRIWYREFNPAGAFAVTDWKVGSKVLFLDNEKSGLVGRIVVNKPGEALSVEYDGFVKDGIEDYESEGAREAKGGRESYYLTEKDGVTSLSIESEMSEEYFEMMSNSWEKALDVIKELAESK